MRGLRLEDGRVLRGETWADVDQAWSSCFMNAIVPPDEWRTEIQNRAKLWSGLDIAVNGSAYDFLQESERAGLVSLIYDATHVADTSEPQPKPTARVVYLADMRRRAAQREERKQQRLAAKGQASAAHSS